MQTPKERRDGALERNKKQQLELVDIFDVLSHIARNGGMGVAWYDGAGRAIDLPECERRMMDKRREIHNLLVKLQRAS